jgi:hypothetical protein
VTASDEQAAALAHFAELKKLHADFQRDMIRAANIFLAFGERVRSLRTIHPIAASDVELMLAEWLHTFGLTDGGATGRIKSGRPSLLKSYDGLHLVCVTKKIQAEEHCSTSKALCLAVRRDPVLKCHEKIRHLNHRALNIRFQEAEAHWKQNILVWRNRDEQITERLAARIMLFFQIANGQIKEDALRFLIWRKCQKNMTK